MSDAPDGSLIRRAALAACLWLASTSPALAQYPHPPGFAPAPASPDLFARTDFRMSASRLTGGDEPFGWDTHFGGDMDVVDYVAGRLVLLVDYEAVIGSEFRTIDPNQGNYTLEPSLSLRARDMEFALVYHHVSRHLGDRAKRFAIDWNILGGRVIRRVSAGASTADITAGVGTFVQHSHVDYRWTVNGDLLIRRPINGRVGAFARAGAETFGVEPAVFGRGRQTGGKVEAGVKISGAGGAIELFGGVERRVDADPLERQPQTWALLGFRFLAR
jgi:hypothetical protein